MSAMLVDPQNGPEVYSRMIVFLVDYIIYTIKLVRTYQEKRRRQHIRKMMDMVVPGKRRRARPTRRWIDNNREDMNKYELTADMTENRQFWKIMVKTDPQRCGYGL